MSAALNLEAERAAWEKWAEQEGRVAYRDEQHGLAFYDAGTKMASWFGWQASAARRTAPAVGADGLRALSDDEIGQLWDMAMNQFQRHERGVSVHPSIYMVRAIERIAADRQAQQYEKGQK